VTLKGFYLFLNNANQRLGFNGGRGGIHIEYWWESQKERDHSEDQDVGGWTILKWILEK
jgi:hypothetical protein